MGAQKQPVHSQLKYIEYIKYIQQQANSLNFFYLNCFVSFNRYENQMRKKRFLFLQKRADNKLTGRDNGMFLKDGAKINFVRKYCKCCNYVQL